MRTYEVVICGAGIAGASLAWRLARRDCATAPHAEKPVASGVGILLLEREAQPGYHSTGRSAAMFMESYGPPQVRALTRASREFYTRPPAGFSDVSLLHPRGALYVAYHGQQALLDETWEALTAITDQGMQRLGAAEALAKVPCLRADQLIGAIAEADATDLDVHALHQGFLRGARAAGVTLQCNAEIIVGANGDGGWVLQLNDGSEVHARTLVNAAGAWADDLAHRCGVAPLGLEPRRRSAFTFKAPVGVDVSAWPAVAAIDESWYFKPDAGRLLGSPANADPTHPHDVQPEELDIAKGIHGIESATTLEIRRPTSTWAGLRTFAPDGEIVIGHDSAAPSFFWLAGQGGYGLQSAAGASLAAATLLRSDPMPDELQLQGVSTDAVSPHRFRRKSAG